MVWSASQRKKRKSKCKNPKGFTMKQFCKNLRTKSKKGERKNNVSSPKKREFMFNKDNPKKSYDLYIDKNPKDTISISYKTKEDVKRTIRKLERLYKSGKYTHKRIKQVVAVMDGRLKVMKDKTGEKALARRYHDFLRERTKIKSKEGRKKLKFSP